MLGVAVRGFDDRGYRIRKETPAQPAPLILQGAMCCKKPAQWQASEFVDCRRTYPSLAHPRIATLAGL